MLYSDREKLEDVSRRLRGLVPQSSPLLAASLGALASDLDGVVSRTAVTPLTGPELAELAAQVVLVAVPYAVVPPELRPSLESLGWTVTDAYPSGWLHMEPPAVRR